MYEIVGSTLTVALSTSANAPAAAAPAWATVSGMSLGYWQQPAMKMPSVIVLTGSSLGCRSRKKPSAEQPKPKVWLTALASLAGARPLERITTVSLYTSDAADDL